jgi:hypothetical protein
MFLWLYSYSRSDTVGFECICYIYCSFKDRLNDLPLIIVLALRDRWNCECSWNRNIMCFSFRIYDEFTQETDTDIDTPHHSFSILTFICVALFNNRHFAFSIPNAHSTHLLARDSLQLRTCLHMKNPFRRKASVGTSLEDRHYPQGWRKAFPSLKTCGLW